MTAKWDEVKVIRVVVDKQPNEAGLYYATSQDLRGLIKVYLKIKSRVC